MTGINLNNNFLPLPTLKPTAQPGLTDMPPEILQKIAGPVARQLRETERPAFAALSKGFAQVVQTMRLTELQDDVARRGHFLPQATSLFPERLPTAAELLRRGCKSPSHINFPRIRAWAKKHFPADKPGPLSRFYDAASQVFWRELKVGVSAYSVNSRDAIQKIDGVWLFRCNPIDPLPDICAASLRLGCEEPLERLEYLGSARHLENDFLDEASHPYFKRTTEFTWPEGLDISLENMRKHVMYTLGYDDRTEGCCEVKEYRYKLELDIAMNDRKKPAYQFSVENQHILKAGICFAEGIHPIMPWPGIVLCEGIQTQVKNNVMQVSLWANSRINVAYPAISKNEAGVYCCFSENLEAQQQQRARELIASGYCQELAAGWSNWIRQKWDLEL